MTALPPTLITGAASRIGRAMALDLAKAGTPVCIHYRSSRDAALETSKTIEQAGGRAITVQGDLVDENDLSSLVDRASEALGEPPGCLVNNASLFQSDAVGDLKPDLFKAHFGVHATAPAVLADRLVSQLPSDAEGLIVNIVDQREIGAARGGVEGDEPAERLDRFRQA